MRTHTGDRPFTCSFDGCDKSFITKGHLQTHILIHTGEKPYQCKTCGKQYARSGRLKIHERTHTGERPFKCNTCGKRFTETGNLKTHLRIHSGSKPYKCEEDDCGKSFTALGHLNEHKKMHAKWKSRTQSASLSRIDVHSKFVNTPRINDESFDTIRDQNLSPKYETKMKRQKLDNVDYTNAMPRIKFNTHYLEIRKPVSTEPPVDEPPKIKLPLPDTLHQH